MSTLTPTLELHQLSCERGSQRLLDRLSLTLHAGQLLVVSGENGAGKTTLLRTLAGLNTLYSGDIIWQGVNIRNDLAAYSQSLIHIGHKPGLKLNLTAYENLQLSRRLALCKPHYNLDAALEQMNLLKLKDQFAYQLSAGQQRRLALAKLLFLDARLWLLDEPFASLDQHGIELIESIFTTHLSQGGILIMTSHQPISLPSVSTIRLAL